MLAAVCIPKFPAPALARLQRLRASHDPEYAGLIAPHVTLVFPDASLEEEAFVVHVRECARDFSAVDVEFFSAREYHEQRSGRDFVYLIPSVGYAWFVKVHGRLCSGSIAAERRRDVAFIPHITVGRFTAPGAALALAAMLDSERVAMAARVDAIDVVRVGKGRVETLHSEPLAK